jgi:hypothetical protein
MCCGTDISEKPFWDNRLTGSSSDITDQQQMRDDMHIEGPRSLEFAIVAVRIIEAQGVDLLEAEGMHNAVCS